MIIILFHFLKVCVPKSFYGSITLLHCWEWHTQEMHVSFILLRAPMKSDLDE